jgi:hypothetical protein
VYCSGGSLGGMDILSVSSGKEDGQHVRPTE